MNPLVRPVKGRTSKGGWRRGRPTLEASGYDRRYRIHVVAMRRWCAWVWWVYNESRARRFSDDTSILLRAPEVVESTLYCTARPADEVQQEDELTRYERAVSLAHDEWPRFPLDIGVERY